MPHTVFETFINNSSRYKTQKVLRWVPWVGDARIIHKSFFLLKFFIKNKDIEKGGKWKMKNTRKVLT